MMISRGQCRLSYLVPLFSRTLSSGHHVEDTIYALSSGPHLKTGVAVIRISGPKSKYCLDQLTIDKSKNLKPRYASLRKLTCPMTREILDHALILWFPAPKSYTGEDIVELHVHGSKAVVDSIFSSFEYFNSKVQRDGYRIRHAEKGEFTKRAYYTGKMDLTEIEGVGDLLFADTSSQRKLALRQMEGHMRRKYESWRDELKLCLAHTEAVIDFGDDDREDHVDDQAMWVLLPRVRSLRQELAHFLEDSKRGELVREGVRVALVGKPNAGKSSLLNALARRPAAIVSPTAGTTRDIVEVRLDLQGVSCIVCDTAGIRSEKDGVDDIELEGIRRAKEAFDAAHIKIFVLDASAENHIQSSTELINSLLPVDTPSTHAEEWNGAQKNPVTDTLIVHNKIDLLSSASHAHNLIVNNHMCADANNVHISSPLAGRDGYAISCVTGDGMDAFERGLGKAVHSLVHGGSEDSVLITRQRHRDHLREAVGHLDVFLNTEGLPMDLAAEELRLAMREIGKLTGTVEVEELLDIIFRDFCIGK